MPRILPYLIVVFEELSFAGDRKFIINSNSILVVDKLLPNITTDVYAVAKVLFVCVFVISYKFHKAKSKISVFTALFFVYDENYLTKDWTTMLFTRSFETIWNRCAHHIKFHENSNDPLAN
jgi:hypothetical protein